MSKTVFLTTIFPASEKYLDDFFVSLQNQNYKDFDILVVNDGIYKFNSYIKRYYDLNIIEIISEQSPAKNREAGIKKALQLGYQYIIFGDSDDYFSKNRVKNSLNALRENVLVVNDLVLFNNEDKIEGFLSKCIKTTDYQLEQIYNSNVFGFSNIAIQSKIIDPSFYFDEDLIAVDWYFITIILLNQKCKMQFLSDVQTYYRQHDSNTIGMSRQLNKQKLDLGIKVKDLHYSALIKYCAIKELKKTGLLFKNKLDKVRKLRNKLSTPSFIINYIQIINFNMDNIFTGWWSEILTLEDYNKYENPIK